jgi:glycosyltransferase involved in cell wall biosynthesis
MDNPLVSVIIPTYLGTEYLGQAIDSVLTQTYSNFEIVVVDDASPDATGALVKSYSDPRIRYIVHETNLGAGEARNTATRAARGEIIAFLDQDDYFHPDKLAQHVAHFNSDSELGASYSGRFELNPSSPTIRDIWHVPNRVSLADLVLGFPIAPSDLVVRRHWFLRPDVSEVHHVFHGGEIIRYGRLYLSGCKFAPVERALSYHRYYAGRVFRNIQLNCEHYLFCQEAIFNDVRCPAEVRALRPRAHTMSYLVWAGYALYQEETALAHTLLRKAAALTPTLTAGEYCDLAKFLVHTSSDSDFSDHESMLRNAYRQLPPELTFDVAQLKRAVAHGYLLRGARCLVWGRDELGEHCFARATQMQAVIDSDYLANLAHMLTNYEAEFGSAAAQQALNRLAPHLDQISGKRVSNSLAAKFAYNRALKRYKAHDYGSVPGDCVRAIAHDPGFVTNRGVLSILVRALAHLPPKSVVAP